MEGRKLIFGLRANVGGKRGDRAGIVCLEFGKGFQVRCCRGTFVLLGPERLKCPDRFRPASQHKIANWPSVKILHFFCKFSAHTDAGSKLLVRCTQDVRQY